MTNQCDIGPVTGLNPQQWTGKDNYGSNESQKFTTTKIPIWKARNIIGLVSPGKRSEYNELQVLPLSSTGWGLIYIDTATSYLPNEDFTHSGWYILRKADPQDYTTYSPGNARVACEADLVSSNPDETLTMTFTKGQSRILQHNYTDLATDTYLQDTFSTFDTNTWHSEVKNNMTSGTVTSTGGKLVFSGASNSDGSWGGEFICSKSNYEAPFYVETDLEWVALPSGGNYDHYFMISFYPERPVQYGDFDPALSSMNWVRIVVVVNSGGAYYYLQEKLSGTVYTITSGNLSGSEKTPKFKFYFDEDGNIQVWVDESGVGGANYVNLYGPAPYRLNFTDPYIVYAFQNKDSTSATVKVSQLDVYNYVQTSYPNNVAMPVGCTMTETADANRPSSYGNIPIVSNPNEPIDFTIDPDDFYDGSVKVYSSNNSLSESRQITNLNEELTPLKFTCNNGLIKLETTATGVKFYYWSAVANDWVLYDTLGVGTISSLKLLNINDNIVSFQINSPNKSIWTLKRGKQTFSIEHPNTNITYTLQTKYEHDGTTTSSPSADADISMLTQYYCNVYTGTDRYRMQINQIIATTIKSDKIPASIYTGIGYYDSTESSSSLNYYLNIAKEFNNQILQKIIISQ